MPKMTAKYKTAMHTARKMGVEPSADQETLYRRLNDNGFWWDSKQKEWVEFASEPANAPTPLIMVRVWAEAGERVEKAVNIIKGAFSNGFVLIQESDPYPCRPPKQKESRVYLQFMPSTGMTKDELIRENDPYAVEIGEAV